MRRYRKRISGCNGTAGETVKVAFYAVSEPYVSMGKYLLDGVRDTMQDVEVWQMGYEKSPRLDGIDGFIVADDKLPMERSRALAQASCEGDWLLVDSDVVIQKDVRGVFNEPFDVAFTDREGTITTESSYAAVMPYNTGVVFSRSPAFWKYVDHVLQQLPARFQEWEGTQRIVAQMMKEEMPFNIGILPGKLFNYPPKSADEDLSHAFITHFKGARKQWIHSKRAA